MDDQVARIDQHPVAMRQAFDAERAEAGLLQVARQPFSDRADMTVRTADATTMWSPRADLPRCRLRYSSAFASSRLARTVFKAFPEDLARLPGA